MLLELGQRGQQHAWLLPRNVQCSSPAKGLTCSFCRRQSRGRVTSRMVFSCPRAARRWRYLFLKVVKRSEWGGVQTHTQHLNPLSQDRNVKTDPRPAKSPGA